MVRTIAVALETIVTHITILLDDRELDVTGPTPIPIELSSAAPVTRMFFRSTVPPNISMPSSSARCTALRQWCLSATTQRKTIQFVVFVDLKAGEFDAGKLQYATTVAVVGTAKLATEILRYTFYGCGGLINRRFAEQNRPPQSPRVLWPTG